MTSAELTKYKINAGYKLAIYVVSIAAATTLAFIGSEYAGEAFALVGGFMGGDALSKL